MSYEAGAVVGTFTVLGDAPKQGGHIYTRVKCKCGAKERAVRVSSLRAGKVTCKCESIAAAAPDTAAAPAVAVAVVADLFMEQQREILSSLQALGTQLGAELGRVDAQLAQILQKLATLPAAAAAAPPKPAPKFSLYTVTGGALDLATRNKKLDESLELAVAMTRLPLSKRTPELKVELAARIAVERARIDQISDPDECFRHSQKTMPIVGRLEDLLKNHWENPHYDNGED